jgi:hypothetical protein
VRSCKGDRALRIAAARDKRKCRTVREFHSFDGRATRLGSGFGAPDAR